MTTRRDFLALSATAAVAGAQTKPWQAGSVEHLIPTASDSRILLKASLRDALTRP
ncbi:MAG: twin-arginine translocation signal domain-containing protein, partial [Acidobacteria bacterium]|nr:twin-arginine translocation signal domain-containing protein [Acidobacteriota bacterium]